MTTRKERARLDVLVFERGLAASREKAQAMILAGEVLVNGVPIQRLRLKAGTYRLTIADLLRVPPHGPVSEKGAKTHRSAAVTRR